MIHSTGIRLSLVVSILLPVLSLLAGLLVYRDSLRSGRDSYLAALLGFIIAGLFLAGSVPGLVALAFTQEAAVQGFPTSVRVLPGVLAVIVYLYFR